MKREHIILVFLALFAGLVTFSPAVSPKFGDIPNPAGMNYGWDGTNNTVRALAVDADGNLQSEATNASTTPANVILRDGSTGAQIGTTTNPLAVGGTVNIVNPKDYAAASSSYAQYYVELATNSVTLLSSVCSFTVPCELVFYNNAAMYQGPSTTASATLQSGHKKVADSEWSVKPGSSGWDMAMIADPAAKASFTVTIYPLVVAP